MQEIWRKGNVGSNFVWLTGAGKGKNRDPGWVQMHQGPVKEFRLKPHSHGARHTTMIFAFVELLPSEQALCNTCQFRHLCLQGINWIMIVWMVHNPQLIHFPFLPRPHSRQGSQQWYRKCATLSSFAPWDYCLSDIVVFGKRVGLHWLSLCVQKKS